MSQYDYYTVAKRQASNRNTEHDDVEHIDLPKQEKAAELSSETDELLDEIDSVLEENAQEFVDAFLQQGGE